MGQKSPLFTQKPSPTAAPNVSPILLCALSVIQKWSVSLRFGARPSPLASRSCSCPPLPWSAQRHLVGTTGAGGGAAERSSGGGAAGAGAAEVEPPPPVQTKPPPPSACSSCRRPRQQRTGALLRSNFQTLVGGD
jgi:hypothetical protein